MKKIILILIPLIIISCSKDGTSLKLPRKIAAPDGSYAVVESYPDGKVKSVISHGKDGVLHGKARYYFRNGGKKSFFSHRDGKRQGLYESYYENGDIEYKGIFNEDKKDSTWTWYSRSQGINRIENYFEGKKFGGFLDFDSLGHFKFYRFYSFDRLLGEIKFTAPGVYKKKGEFIYSMYAGDEISKDTEYSLMLFVAEPPGFNAEAKFTLIDFEGQSKIVQPSCSNEGLVFRCLYEQTFNISGRYQIICEAVIKDDYGEVFWKDDLKFDLTVTE